MLIPKNEAMSWSSSSYLPSTVTKLHTIRRLRRPESLNATVCRTCAVNRRADEPADCRRPTLTSIELRTHDHDPVVHPRRHRRAHGLTLALAACSSPTSTTSASPSAGTPSASASVDVKTLTVTPGKLTIATGQPAYSPWAPERQARERRGVRGRRRLCGGGQARLHQRRRGVEAHHVRPGHRARRQRLGLQILQQFSITDERKEGGRLRRRTTPPPRPWSPTRY